MPRVEYPEKPLHLNANTLHIILFIINDLCYVQSDELKLAELSLAPQSGEYTTEIVDSAINELKGSKTGKFLKNVCSRLSKFDWRTSDAPGLTDNERILRASFRGSGGYKELRNQLLTHLEKPNDNIGKSATNIRKTLGYI